MMQGSRATSRPRRAYRFIGTVSPRQAQGAQTVPSSLSAPDAELPGQRVQAPPMTGRQSALARGESGIAREAMQEALREARDQKAVWPELTVLIALCERDNAAPEDFDALAEAYARLSEGFDS